MREILKQRLARQDLIEIWHYTADLWGDDQADTYLDLIGQKLNLLKEHPALGRPCSMVRPGYRSIQAGRHQVFYKLDGEDILVVRVLHVSVDVDAHISSE